MLLGKRLSEGARFRLDASVLLGAIPLWSRWNIEHYGYSIYPGDTATLQIFSAVVDYGLDIYLLASFRVQGTWQARNHNRWSLMLEGRSTLTNFYEGGYTL